MSLTTRLRGVAARLYGGRWPVGLRRLRGAATIEVGGQRLAFTQIAGSPGEWWASQARKRRWEQPVVDAFVATLRPGDVAYDIGAWIGPYTLLAAKLVGPTGRGFSFEPDPVAREVLTRNVEHNDLDNVRVLPIALSAQAGTAWLSGGGSEARIGAEGDYEVETLPLPNFVAAEGAPDVIKLDIEGGEVQLDRAALSAARAVFLEVHVPVFRQAGVDPDAFMSEVAAGRQFERLEGNADNFNVRIGR